MKRMFESVLLVEDEQHLAGALQIAIKKLGIDAIHASTLSDARAFLFNVTPELIILDLNLPDGDGKDLCRELRAKDYSGTILMLTARSGANDRVAGLNCGADDYLEKPFSWEELEARINALSRRAHRSDLNAENSLWQVDADRLRILGPKGWIELTPLEFKLVAHLIAANGAIVGRDELLKKVWGFSLLPKTRTVDHFMGRVRKLFEDDADQPRHFITVRGAGYRFER